MMNFPRITKKNECSVLALAVVLSTLSLVLGQGEDRLDDWKLLLPCGGGLLMWYGCHLKNPIVAAVKKRFGVR